MNINDNIDNTAVNPENIPNMKTQVSNEPEQEVVEEEIGEHDIVIEEDFQINLEIADVSKVSDILEPQKEEIQNQEVNLGTEQSGNITF